jgi:hypothetical protein
MTFPSLHRLRAVYIFIFFAALTFLAYHKSLSHEFMLDDHAILLAQEPGLASIGKALDYKDKSHVFFRPVTNLFRLLLVNFLPKEPVYYHLVNILLFAVHVTLAFFVLGRLLEQKNAAFWACFLYALHPVNAAFINYITGHEILLFGIFLDLGALFLLRYCEGLRNKVFLSLSVLCFVLALFTQEISIMFLFFVFLVSFQFLKNVSFKQAFEVCFPYCAVAAVYVAWRFFLVTHTVDYIQRMFQYTDRMSIDMATYVNTVFELIGWYLGQMVFPSQLVLIKTMPAITSGLDLKVIALLALALVLFLVFRRRWKGNPSLFAILWFLTGFMALFGLALIYPYGGFVIEPHWFLFSSLGFFLCLGLIIEHGVALFTKVSGKYIVYMIIALLAGFWFRSTQSYNHLWRSQESYCRYWLSISPDFYFPNFWLARGLLEQNKLDEAEVHFKRSFVGKANDWYVYAGLGDIEFERNDLHKAREYYLEALRLNPDSVFLKKNVKWLDQQTHTDKVLR